jgi:amino acid transporter
VIFGFLLGTGNFNHLFQGSPFALDFGGLKTIGLSLMWIMFAYSGWNASAYIGSEVKDPQKNLPRSLMLGTGTVILVYFFINLSPGFPFVQLVFMLFGVFILLLSFFKRPAGSSIALATVAIGIPIYWIFKKRKKIIDFTHHFL